jgi:hypothetical protein
MTIVAAVWFCAALMIERTALERRGCGASGAGLLWLNEAAMPLPYVRTFHRLHLLRLWTHTIY